MKRLAFIFLMTCLIPVGTADVFALEFSLNGESVWRYRFVTRTGMNDIFGYMNGDSGINLGVNHLRLYPTPATNNPFGDRFTNINYSIGVIAGEHNFGPDMGLTDFRTTIYPTLKINRALKIEASVNLTSLGIHSNGRPFYNMEMDDFGQVDSTGGGWANSMWVPISDRMAGSNVPNTFMTVQWSKMSVKTPIVDLSLGYKTSQAGIGLWKNDKDRPSASFEASANYGPFKFGISPYFGRAESNWDTWPRNDRRTHNIWRREGDRNYFGGLSMKFNYASGPLEINFAQEGWHTPNWPDRSYESRQGTGLPDDDIKPGPPGEDTWVYDTTVGLKYANGWSFFNAEVSHFWEYNSGRGTIRTPSDLYITKAGLNQDAWLYGAEAGVFSGPFMLTLSYVRATGDDPSTRITNEDALNGNSGVSPYAMIHWGYLMYYTYGTGVGWNAAGEGQCSNFHHAGARIDYAAAANLNLFGVISKAWRDQVNAFMLGGNGLHTAEAVDNDTMRWVKNMAGGKSPRYTPRELVAVVPESAKDIGWEVDWGFDWKLIENLEWNLTCALWYPGSFWGYAYPNTGALYNDPTVGGFLELNISPTSSDILVARSNPDRKIDPIFSMQTTLGIHF